MTITYFQIVRVLWSSDTIPGHKEMNTKKENYCRSNNFFKLIRRIEIRFFFIDQKPKTLHYESNSTTVNQLKARRKASKMLVIVVLIFTACYFPVHVLNILRYTYTDIDQSEIISIFFLFSHWLDYSLISN